MLQLAKENQPIDYLTVKNRLEQDHQLEKIAGPAYLSALGDGVPRSSNVSAYSAIVKDRAHRRRLLAAAKRIAAEAENLALDTRTVLENAEREIFAAAQTNSASDFVDADALVAEGIPQIEKLLEAKQGVTGVATGFTDIDGMTRGLQPGDLVILAARPSAGKTALSLNIAYHAATHGHSVGFFSLEMSRLQLFMRVVAAESRLDSHRIQSGYLSQTDYSRLSESFSKISDSRLAIDDTPSLGVLELRGKARRLKARKGLGLLVLDYIQLMHTGKAENRNVAIAEVTRP
jgi:replicative DNA helicase